MSSGRRVCATVIAAAALLVCVFRAAFVPAWANDDDDPHAILFSGRDLWLNGAFAHDGFLFAPSGLDQDGLLLKILFAGGLYRSEAKSLGGESARQFNRTANGVWYESPSSMVAPDASLSSIATSNSARVVYGWRVFEDMLGGIYLGPVVEYFRSEGYRHLRLGSHVTSMKAEDTEWSAAAGWAQDSQGRASPFLRLKMLKRL